MPDWQSGIFIRSCVKGVPIKELVQAARDFERQAYPVGRTLALFLGCPDPDAFEEMKQLIAVGAI
jgi:hypothetical protein